MTYSKQELRQIRAKADKDIGRRAYSDAFNHIIVNLHGRGESGLDLACAVQLRTDLDRAINDAAIPDENYI